MIRFPYRSRPGVATSMMPRLPIRIAYGAVALEADALLDTGAAINVLPHSLGLALGADWEQHTTRVPLTGFAEPKVARALNLAAMQPAIMGDEVVRLIFAWSPDDRIPLVFGQMNFFMEFDACFFGNEQAFEIRRRSR